RGEDGDPEVAVLGLAGRQRDRADVDREGAARVVAAPAREAVGLAADVERCLGGAAERPVVDAARRADAGRAGRAGRRLCGPRQRGRERGQECEATHHDPPFASDTWASSAFRTLPTCWLTIG